MICNIFKLLFNFNYDAHCIFNWLMSTKNVSKVKNFFANFEILVVFLEMAIITPILSFHFLKEDCIFRSLFSLLLFFLDLGMFLKLANIPIDLSKSKKSCMDFIDGLSYYISSYFLSKSIISLLVKINNIKIPKKSFEGFLLNNGDYFEIAISLILSIIVLIVIYVLYPKKLKDIKKYNYVKPTGVKYIILWALRVNLIVFLIFVLVVVCVKI